MKARIPKTSRQKAAKRAKLPDPADWSDDEYAMVTCGNCLDPLITDGAAVMFKKSEPVAAGDIVIVWLRPHYLQSDSPGYAWVKRLASNVPSNADGKIFLEQFNPPKQFWVKSRAVLAVHKAVGYVPEHLVKGESIDPANIQPLHAAAR